MRSERAVALWSLAIVAGAFLAIQLGLFSFHRAPSWDESVYLSQVTPDAPAVFFAPSRARGISLLVAPVTTWSDSIESVRIYLAILSSCALAAAFVPWVSLVGLAAPLAALLFGFSWLGLFYGSEVMPNLWTALMAVAASGVVASMLVGKPRTRPAIVVALLVFAMAMFRPLDATAVAIPMLVAVAIRGMRSAVVIGCGLVAGWIPWVVEMSVRFGGLRGAFEQGGSVGHLGGGGGIGHSIVQYAKLTDGPTLGPDAGGIPIAGVIGWAAFLSLVAVALSGASRRSLITATVSAAAVGGLYLVIVGGYAPRFLLPAIGLLSVPAAVGALTLVRGGRVARGVGLVVVVAMVPWLVWQGSIADRIEGGQATARAEAWSVGVEIRTLASGRACVFASSEAFPQLQLASRCVGGPTPDGVANAADRLLNLETDARRFLVERGPQPVVPPAWVVVRRIPSSQGQLWFVLQSAPQ